ncbi:MAG: hydroxymethylbilane synthase [Legionellales bacterium]|nr:hydroxymethylbilane synthase [Legionellales bacterium]
MSQSTLRIATRKSPLALWQASHIREQLLQHWPSLQIDLVPLVTSGDQFLKNKLSATGGKGLFVKELEEALLEHRADIAVHSMKDVPATFPKGLSLSVICTRLNPWDALLCEKHSCFLHLPQGAVIGTASLRRQSQLLAIRPDLHILPLRGNLQTRLSKLHAGDFDAIVLAVAGLQRLGLNHLITEVFSASQMLPACGQGALGIECRADDLPILSLIAPLRDPLSTLCVNAERQVNALLGGNCHVPLAVYCQPIANSEVLLEAKVATPDGQTIICNTQQGPEQNAQKLADLCARVLLDNGAREILRDIPS